jgi:hypothetical protein
MMSQKPSRSFRQLGPVCGAFLDMRDLGQRPAHVDDQEIEIDEGSGAAPA